MGRQPLLVVLAGADGAPHAELALGVQGGAPQGGRVPEELGLEQVALHDAEEGGILGAGDDGEAALLRGGHLGSDGVLRVPGVAQGEGGGHHLGHLDVLRAPGQHVHVARRDEAGERGPELLARPVARALAVRPLARAETLALVEDLDLAPVAKSRDAEVLERRASRNEKSRLRLASGNSRPSASSPRPRFGNSRSRLVVVARARGSPAAG